MSSEGINKIKELRKQQPDSFFMQARTQVETEAQNLRDTEAKLEEHIAFVGGVLDDLKDARQLVGDALRASEKLRMSFNEPVPIEGQGLRSEDRPLNPGRF